MYVRMCVCVGVCLLLKISPENAFFAWKTAALFIRTLALGSMVHPNTVRQFHSLLQSCDESIALSSRQKASCGSVCSRARFENIC